MYFLTIEATAQLSWYAICNATPSTTPAISFPDLQQSGNERISTWLMMAWLLLLSLLFTITVECSATCEPLPYQIYWNVGESDPLPAINLSDFLIFPANFTQTGSGCSNPGCKPWSQGFFPTISASGEIVNGGVPQNANLTAHLERLAKTVVDWIPDPDWSGNAVLDFEAWTTVWELNNGAGDWHSARYVNYSIYLEKLKHPDWNDSAIVAAAKGEFQTAATNFFVQTLKTVTELRPKVKLSRCTCCIRFLYDTSHHVCTVG